MKQFKKDELYAIKGKNYTIIFKCIEDNYVFDFDPSHRKHAQFTLAKVNCDCDMSSDPYFFKLIEYALVFVNHNHMAVKYDFERNEYIELTDKFILSSENIIK